MVSANTDIVVIDEIQKALKEEEIFKNFVCVYMGSLPKQVEGIEILPYITFLDYLWEGKYG